MAQFDNNELYLVQVSDRENMEIAIHIETLGTDLSWFDALRMRRIPEVKTKEYGGSEGIIEATGLMSPGHERIYVFQPLTLDAYNKYIREQLEGKPKFKTQRAMVNFFHNLSSW